MMHVITKVAITAAVPAVIAVGLGYLAMKAPRPETAQLLYAHAGTVAALGILAGVVVWWGHYIKEGLRHTGRTSRRVLRETDEAKVRMLMLADLNGDNVDAIFGPKEM